MREELAPRMSAAERDRGLLKSVRDADLASAVRREQEAARRKGLPITPAEAKDLTLQRIDSEGIAAVCPNFARVRTRMGLGNDVQLDDKPRRVKVHTATQFQPDPEAAASPSNGPDLDRMRATIAAAEDAGEDASDSRALLAYLEAESEQ